MDRVDRAIINEIQSDFPLTSRPYLAIARRVKSTEKEVFERVKGLRQRGIIRRIGGNFHSRKLNFTSTLCAARVPGHEVERFVDAVNRYPGVTHNYLRNHNYNIWFTFIAQDMGRIEQALMEISERTGVRDIFNLPAIKMFKIKVDFEV
ncbi:MAG: AsnC family transcriptional regulator [Thermodesulfobacteriota bacterium]